MLSKLNHIGGEHGIGRVDLVENRFVGMKSRGSLRNARRHHSAGRPSRARIDHAWTARSTRLRDSLGTKFAESVYYGFWFAPEFEILKSMVDQTQETVNGDVRLKLYKGNVTVTGRKSPNSLYRERVVTFEDDAGAYDQHDAEGFIKLQALRLRLRNME